MSYRLHHFLPSQDHTHAQRMAVSGWVRPALRSQGREKGGGFHVESGVRTRKRTWMCLQVPEGLLCRSKKLMSKPPQTNKRRRTSLIPRLPGAVKALCEIVPFWEGCACVSFARSPPVTCEQRAEPRALGDPSPSGDLMVPFAGLVCPSFPTCCPCVTRTLTLSSPPPLGKHNE